MIVLLEFLGLAAALVACGINLMITSLIARVVQEGA